MIRLQQFSSNPLLLEGPDEGTKWNAVIEMLDWEQGPFIIWTQFIRTADLVSQRCRAKKLRVESLTGETPAMKRQDIVDKMQNGQLDVIVAHPGVGKFGLTLTAVRTTFYLERSFNGDDFYQSLYRNKRIGTEYPPHVYLMISTRPSEDGDTIDGVVHKVLTFRRDSAIKLTTGVLRQMLGVR
jgi:SNF2 family DNA or RNA helicase